MLGGIANNPIIAGAYTNSDGICPMLAAHRAGGRTNLIAFAHAWDRFAFRGARKARARRATERELLVLRTYLEASLLADELPLSELAAARREHEELVRRRHERRVERRSRSESRPAARPGDPDRSAELGHRPGWAWTRPVRRYDDYEQVLTRLEELTQSSTPAAPITR
jgi:hypothetical protein